MKTPKLSRSRLLQVLDYDPQTGIFRWKISNGRRAVVGEIAGSVQVSGHIHIGIDKRRYGAHRLAWLYVHGVWPSEQIDHKNCVPHDNRLNNLREATSQQNARNKPGWRSTPKGVLSRPCGKKWRARIRVDRRLISLGDFHTEEEAAAAYKVAAEKHFGEFARV